MRATDFGHYAVIAVASVLFGMTIRIIQQYYCASREAKKRGDWRGIMPRHVWTIGTSYILLLASTVGHHLVRMGEPMTWFVALDLIAYFIGGYALLMILKFENRRVHHGRLDEDEEQARRTHCVGSKEERPRLYCPAGRHHLLHPGCPGLHYCTGTPTSDYQ